jgi:3-isopropylmalate/(R)-2-methylmalate dehydratase small subunit
MRWGIRAVVGVSFAEIFYGNCLALGIPCATASAAEVEAIQRQVNDRPDQTWSLDLKAEQLSSADQQWSIAVDEGPRQMLLSGRWDATSQLLAHGPEVQQLMEALPYIKGFSNV